MKQQPYNYLRITIGVSILAMLLGGLTRESHAWNKRSKSDNAHDQLNRPIGVVWSDAPLRDVLTRLAKSQGVTIWLDRRVDPDRRVSLVASDEPLKNVLARVAKEQGLGIRLFQSVVYIGPPRDVAQLRTLGYFRREEAQKLPPRAAKRFLGKRSMRWDNLATPRELLTALAGKNQVTITNPQLVVHDLWPAMELPPMTLVDRLTLILASLDLTFHFEDRGNHIRLAPIPERVALTRRYQAGAHPKSVARRWSQLLPDAQIRVEGNQIVVEALLEDHERLAKLNDPSRHEPGQAQHSSGKGNAQLRIKQVKFKDLPLAAVVRQLAAQLKLELRFDADALRRSGVDVDRHVSLELEDVSIDELFRAILEPAGLTFRLEGSTLEIRAKQPWNRDAGEPFLFGE